MKRKDAFRKLRTICQRLDDPDYLEAIPRRLYLFGSVLTDKPKPADIDLVLVFDYPPDYDFERELMAMSYRKPLLSDRAVIELRRGMKMIQMHTAQTSLRNWPQGTLLLFVDLKLIWEPGSDWEATLAEIETNPLPWEGEQETSQQDLDKLVKALPQAELDARFEAALARYEGKPTK